MWKCTGQSALRRMQIHQELGGPDNRRFSGDTNRHARNPGCLAFYGWIWEAFCISIWACGETCFPPYSKLASPPSAHSPSSHSPCVPLGILQMMLSGN
eukprot:scaffold52587_cov13-Tisochrysis_lutea.AAC.1